MTATRRRRAACLAAALLGVAGAASFGGCGGMAAGAHEEAVTVDVAFGRLSSTLLVPAGRGPFPTALLVSGSGPTDRDGNSRGRQTVRNDALRLLAGDLAARGVASLRFDKRGVGESAAAAPSERDVRLDDFVADVGRWRARLAADARLGRVTLVGHSEGALIALAAARTTDVAAVVTLAGPGRRLDAVLLDQLAAQLPPAQVRAAARVLDELRAGRRVPRLPAELPAPLGAALFRPAVQGYWTSLLALDPREEARAVAARGVPVTVVQGTTDLQVTVADAERLAEGAGRPARLFAGMNHVLRRAPAWRVANLATYAIPQLPLADGLADTVAAAVRRGGPPR